MILWNESVSIVRFKKLNMKELEIEKASLSTDS